MTKIGRKLLQNVTFWYDKVWEMENRKTGTKSPHYENTQKTDIFIILQTLYIHFMSIWLITVNYIQYIEYARSALSRRRQLTLHEYI